MNSNFSLKMADSYSEPSNPNDSQSQGYKRRSVIACNKCRKLKMKVRTVYILCSRLHPHISICQCDNINMEPCLRCVGKNLTCEYSEASPAPNNPPQPLPLFTTVRNSRERNGYTNHWLHRVLLRLPIAKDSRVSPPRPCKSLEMKLLKRGA